MTAITIKFNDWRKSLRMIPVITVVCCRVIQLRSSQAKRSPGARQQSALMSYDFCLRLIPDTRCYTNKGPDHVLLQLLPRQATTAPLATWPSSSGTLNKLLSGGHEGADGAFDRGDDQQSPAVSAVDLHRYPTSVSGEAEHKYIRPLILLT